MTKAPRVVLDTNVVVSALLFASGRLAPLRMAWQRERIVPLLSQATAAELLRVLRYPKFKLSTAEQEELLADYLPYCTVLAIAAARTKVPACRDPLDVPFLRLALYGKAEYLVTGDQDLMAVTDPVPCEILGAASFMRALNIA